MGKSKKFQKKNAELYGILAALHNVRDEQKVTIYLDCQSAIDAVNNYNNTEKLEIRTKFKYKNILENIRLETNRINNLKLKHIKGHAGLEGNTEADQECTDRMSDKKFYNFGKHKLTDYYTIRYNNELCNTYSRDYIKEIIYSIRTTERDCIIADEKFNYIIYEFHKVSFQVTQIPEYEKFLFLARSNQLATLSKKAKWGNEKDPEFVECKICNSGETENQLHLFLLCKRTRKINNKFAYKVREYLLKKASIEKSIPNIKLWGIPATITQFGIIFEDLDQLSIIDQLKIYIGSCGLVTTEQSDQINTSAFKKPSTVLLKLNKMIIEHFKNLWHERNMHYANIISNQM